MINQYPLWKYILIGMVFSVCTLYALPNLFGEDPALQISPAYAHNVEVTAATEQTALGLLTEAGVQALRAERSPERLLLRFRNTEEQLKAYSALQDKLPGFVIAQNLASATPSWLTSLGAMPMYLGLDLRGGVHFLMEVDMETAILQDEDRFVNEFRTLLRKQKLRYKSIARLGSGGVELSFNEAATRDEAVKLIQADYTVLALESKDHPDGSFTLFAQYTEKALKEAKAQAVDQNITTLRNRVNELGVAEPVIQRQGEDRIVVQLPGVQDTARAKEILGATATLEFRMVYGSPEEWYEAERSGKIPPNARLYTQRDGRGPVLLKRSVIATGDQIDNAVSSIDQQEGGPIVMVTLNSLGGKRMFATTRENVGKLMSVVFIESKIKTEEVNGEKIKKREKREEVISTATIRGEFGKRFQITGLSSQEANNLALLLRAGALKAPIEIVEERTIGPSLGQANINQGMNSILFGFVLVLIFMWLRYRQFGMVANAALLLNVVILIALLSMLQATLTLPGIAGILLTIGMAVDANVLIFERIREEIANGNSPQASIHAGFGKAFGTILDANITTLIAAIVLFSFGTGPVKGFAVTLSLGIISSMFTAIMVSRAIINYLYGGKKLDQLSV